MPKGGKRYANMDQDGKWFANIDIQQWEKTREACTSTGAMLAQANSQPILQGAERYPKIFINPEKKTRGRSYVYSAHDNRALLQDSIETYGCGLGRKKCLDDHRQHNSHFCLSHDGSLSAVGFGRRDHPAYRTNFLPKQDTVSTEGPHSRRFPRSHLEQSHHAAVAQAGERFMWFGRHDLDQPVPLNVLAAAIQTSSSY